VKQTSWPRSSIDRFILAKLEERGLRPAPPADPRVLLRRVTFDLIGLPPTPAEVRAFLDDTSPDAFGKVVDRLLASPRYGERWGRHWMDVVRYADTAGDNADYPVPEARLYRDYIIDSFNADKPYNQFVREQLAGDILAKEAPSERYAERVVATGFLALSRRYATAPFEFMHLTIEDAIETTGRTFLGLTLRCARCHDHKYDPVTKEDYYALYGIFASTRFPYAGSEEFQSKNSPRSGFVPLVPAEDAAQPIEENRRSVEGLRVELARLEKSAEAAKTNAELKKAIEAQLKPIRSELKRREKFGSPPGLPVAYAVAEDKPVNESVQLHGEPAEKGAVVSRRAPCRLGVPGELRIPEGASGRLQLAEWMASETNPLTARVMVNRIWQHHFGQGLVGTPSNFGLRGDLPTHPELLDFLAGYFLEHGWSIKAVHRLVLNSAVYQQASVVDEFQSGGSQAQVREKVSKRVSERPCADVRPSHSPAYSLTHSPSSGGKKAELTDPANHLHWHYDARRLDAEAIRDAMLLVAGRLNLDRPGRHPFPPFEDWSWTQHNPFKAIYDSDHRSVYLMTQRIQRHPYLALFDAPDANVSTDTRSDSTVPLQALYLMNSPFLQAQALAFARRVLESVSQTDERIRLACELAWSRPLSPEEMRRARDYLERYRVELARIGTVPEQVEAEAWASYARVLLTANEFFYVD
jgi:hypothetical protein